MSDIANIATRGLLAFRSAMQTISNNISNVGTEGYSKQQANFSSTQSLRFGSTYLGTGVQVSEVERLTDEFADRLMHESISDFNLNDSFYDRAVVVDSYFSQEGINLSDNLNDFFESLSRANEAPDTTAPRNLAMEKLEFLADQIVDVQKLLDDTQDNLNQQLSDTVLEMSSISENIAQLNRDILSNGSSPELLDHRDELVRELASFINVQTSIDNNGLMDVNIGRGEPLVVGTLGLTVSVGQSQTDGSTQIFTQTSNVTYEITRNISGGSVEGLVNFETNVLREMSREIGLISMGLADRMNEQNQLGLDFNGNLGQSLLTDFNSTQLQINRAVSYTSNTSVPAASLQIPIDDISLVQVSDYTLSMTGLLTGNLTRESDGTTFALTFAVPGAGAPPDLEIDTVDGVPASNVDGFEIDFTNSPAAGDRFTISPTRDMSRHMRVIEDDPLALALAAPIRTYTDNINTGDGTITLSSITTVDTTAGNLPDLQDQFRINILDLDPAASPTNDFQYEIINITDGTTLGTPPGPPLFYGDLGEPLTVYDDTLDIGYEVIIDGDIRVGDGFFTEFNTNGTGDNYNGLLIAGIQEENFLGDSTETLNDVYAKSISKIGTQTFQANLRSDAAKVMFEQAQANKLSAVGVNLDEEAADLVLMQQAYQATGQLIAISKELIDILFSVVSR